MYLHWSGYQGTFHRGLEFCRISGVLAKDGMGDERCGRHGQNWDGILYEMVQSLVHDCLSGIHYHKGVSMALSKLLNVSESEIFIITLQIRLFHF